jgi:hypothetical protein
MNGLLEHFVIWDLRIQPVDHPGERDGLVQVLDAANLGDGALDA